MKVLDRTYSYLWCRGWRVDKITHEIGTWRYLFFLWRKGDHTGLQLVAMYFRYAWRRLSDD